MVIFPWELLVFLALVWSGLVWSGGSFGWSHIQLEKELLASVDEQRRRLSSIQIQLEQRINCFMCQCLYQYKMLIYFISIRLSLELWLSVIVWVCEGVCRAKQLGDVITAVNIPRTFLPSPTQPLCLLHPRLLLIVSFGILGIICSCSVFLFILPFFPPFSTTSLWACEQVVAIPAS